MIKNIRAREILDSRKNPTVEVELGSNDVLFKASVPSGASIGKYEALELRDGEKRYQGKGVLNAVKNINEIIGPKLKGKDVTRQKEIDDLMIKLDGTENKSKLGANAILGVSMAVCRAGAAAQGIPLYQHIAAISSFKCHPPGSPPAGVQQVSSFKIPFPCFNIINGGAHAGNDLDIQEFMIIPQESSFSENLRIGTEIYRLLKGILRKTLGEQAINVGDEGGFAPPISRASQALDFISQAIKNYSRVKIGLDCAATQFYKNGKYYLEGTVFTKQGLLTFYQDLVKNYPIVFIEDPFAEEDWESWKKLEAKILTIGDDLTATNKDRVEKAVKEDCIGGIIIKPNQRGTITETLECLKTAREAGLKIIVSHRSGETKDDFIADLAVGIQADFIKSGAPARGERLAKYNRLLKIEEELIRTDDVKFPS